MSTRCSRAIVRSGSRPAAVAALVAAASAAGLTLSGPAQARTAPREPAATAIDAAMAAIGTPYAWGGAGARGYDCSGLTLTAYRAAGIRLPRLSRQQYLTTARIPLGQAAPGDLVFWGHDVRNPASVYHVAVYLGSNMVLVARKTGTVVQLQRLYRRGLMPFAVRPAGVTAVSVLPVRPGTRGADVRLVQRRLRANGYDVPVTGYYGPITTRAVRNVQRRGRLTGALVGASTWQYLLTHGARDANR